MNYLKTRWIRWMAWAASIYVTILLLLMFFESSLVYPAPRGGSAIAAEFGAEDVRFESADGTLLHGWYFERTGADQTLVFFHGNAESIEYSGPWIGGFAKSLNANVFIFDYRGYGKSQGRPFEKGIVEDGVAAIEWLSQRTGQTSDQFVYLGRSLGGGVAIQVAIQKKPRAFILVSAFSSMVDVASDVWWWLPVRTLMRNRYECEKTIAQMDVPLLQIHGESDRIIPIRLGRKLFQAATTSKKEFVVAPKQGHNNLSLELLRPQIAEFLSSFK